MSRSRTVRSKLILWVFLLCLFLPSVRGKESSIELQTAPSMQQQTQYILYCMEQAHYLKSPISNLDTNKFLETYMKNLDSFRLFFLQSDIEKYKTLYSPTISLYLRQGKLLPAFSIFQAFRERCQQRIAWIFERIDENFDFSKKEQFMPDRTKASWPSTPEEADTLWRQRLKYEIINEILSLEDEAAPLFEKLFQNIAETYTQWKNNFVQVLTPPEVETVSFATPLPGVGPLREPYKKTLSYATKLSQAKINIKKRYERLLKTYNELEAVEIQEIFLNSLTHVFDPHSGFLSPYYLEEFDISIRNSLVGIGALLADEEGYCTIKEIIPGSPAEKSKRLHPGDKIIGVSQKNGELIDVIGMKLRKIVSIIRGKEGSVVRLLIQPGGADPSHRYTLPITRAEIKLTTNLANATVFEVPYQNKSFRVGVIDLPTFYGTTELDEEDFNTTNDVEELIQKLKKLEVEGIILDLRCNGGGLLREAISLTGLFIHTGPVLQSRNITGQIDLFRNDNAKMAWSGPLIILVSRLSASASEIVAGALQNHNRAIIVGDSTTHGKGTVQAVYNLEAFNPRQKGAAKVTVQKWYLPDGNSIQNKGIHSDIAIPSLIENLPIGESFLDNALPWDSITPLPLKRYNNELLGNATPVDQKLIETLRKKSEKRQGSLEEFALLKRQINWSKKQQEKKVYSLRLMTRKKERERENDFRKNVEDQMEILAKKKFPHEEVLLEAATENDSVEPSEENEFLDIQLRECLRIMTDWIAIEEKKVSEPVSIYAGTNTK